MAASTNGDRVEAIDTTVQKTYHWLHELSDELGGSGRSEAYRVLRAFLHTLRDRLNVDEAADLAAQLPMLVRGLYFEGWDPSQTPRKMGPEEFTANFARMAVLPEGLAPQPAMAAAFRVLRRNVTEGEIDDVLRNLPEHVRALLETPAG